MNFIWKAYMTISTSPLGNIIIYIIHLITHAHYTCPLPIPGISLTTCNWTLSHEMSWCTLGSCHNHVCTHINTPVCQQLSVYVRDVNHSKLLAYFYIVIPHCLNNCVNGIVNYVTLLVNNLIPITSYSYSEVYHKLLMVYCKLHSFTLSCISDPMQIIMLWNCNCKHTEWLSI